MAGSNQVKAPDPGHCGPAGAPEAVNCSLTEGYLGDTIVTAQRRELVIEEGVPFFLFHSLFPARELQKAGTILVLARRWGREYCLAVSIYTPRLHDINTLFHHCALFMVAFLSYETLGLPFVVAFNPIITRIQGLDPLFCSRLTTWPTWILLFFF